MLLFCSQICGSGTQARICCLAHSDSCYVCWAQCYSGSLLTLQILRTHYSVLHVNLFLRASPGSLSISLFSGPKVDAFLHDSWLPRGRQWKLPNHKKLFCILLVKTVIWCAWVQGVKKQSAPVHGVIGRLCHRRAIRMGALIDVSYGLTNSFWGAERIFQDSGSSWGFETQEAPLQVCK